MEFGGDVTCSSTSSGSTLGGAFNEYLKKFHNSDSAVTYQPQDVIRFMLEHPIIKKKLDDWLSQDPGLECLSSCADELDDLNFDGINTRLLYKKCHEHGRIKRNAGNKLYQQRKLTEALECYNEALRNCAFKSEEHVSDISDIGICLANRSAVLFEMGKYVEALQDIDLALKKYKYPPELWGKVHLRKLSALVKLHELEEACKLLDKCYEQYPELIEKLDEIKRSLGGASASSPQNSHKEPDSTASSPKINFNQNPNYENASVTIEAQYSEICGRHVISLEDLKLGDVVYCEHPFASVLLPDYFHSHCYQCHRELNPFTFFPCRNCTQVNYCNESCSIESWTESHQYECLHLKFLVSTGIAHLALRIVLVAGVAEVLKTVAQFKLQNKELKGDLTIFKTGAQPYLRVYSLLDHLQDMNPEDAFQYALTASLLTHFLQTRTTFLKSTKLDEDEIVGGAILHHICQLICNANAISSIQPDAKSDSARLDEFSQVRIASAIYPSASLMNHSCSPNILSVFKDGRTLIVRIAIDQLSARSEIFNCYGPHFRRTNYKTRQENLAAQYFFNCKCTECAKELQESSSFADKFSAFKCTHCDGPVQPDYNSQCFVVTCANCQNSVNLKQSMELALETDKYFAEGMEFMDRGDIRKALDKFITCYDLRKKILYPFHSDLGNFSDCLAKCYSILANYSEALKFTTQSLEYVQERFGINSIEWAREFKKFMDLKETCQVEEVPCDDSNSKLQLDLEDPQKFRELNETADKMITLYNSTSI